jgi:hypothetical protein
MEEMIHAQGIEYGKAERKGPLGRPIRRMKRSAKAYVDLINL